MPGFFGVLHTWGSQMPYHPHIHYIVPGGAFFKTDGKWHCSRIDFFLPVKTMSKIFKAKFRWRTIALDIMEFIRRFLQHVLPTGFMKVRYYGFLNPNCAVPLEKISALIELAFGFEIVTPKTVLEPPESMICTGCGGSLAFRASLLPCKRVSADSR